MMTLSIIGFILCFLCVWILKNTRSWITKKPVLRMWQALLLIMSALVPIWNFIIGLSILIVIGIGYLDDFEWKDSKPSWLYSFLTKRIS